MQILESKAGHRQAGCGPRPLLGVTLALEVVRSHPGLNSGFKLRPGDLAGFARVK